MDPLVSILIPAYNAEEWLVQTLRSAVGQTWPRKEIIVVNDGSRDRTLEIARQFASKEVKVFSQANAGAAATRNKAYSLSQGDYIQWLDADDLLGADKISRQVAALDRNATRRTLLSGPWGRFMYRSRKADFQRSPLWENLSPVEWLLRKMELNLHMQTATWLVSRDLTEAAGPWDTRLLGDDDGEYFCRVLMASDGVRFVPDAKVYYRMAGSRSLSYIGNSGKKMEAQFCSMELHIRYVRTLEDSERVRRACVQYLQNWLPNFHPGRPDIVSKAQDLAASLGGRLEMPSLSWKYSWIQKLFGWNLARRAQLFLPHLKWSFLRWWDRSLSRMENRSSALHQL